MLLNYLITPRKLAQTFWTSWENRTSRHFQKIYRNDQIISGTVQQTWFSDLRFHLPVLSKVYILTFAKIGNDFLCYFSEEVTGFNLRVWCDLRLFRISHLFLKAGDLPSCLLSYCKPWVDVIDTQGCLKWCHMPIFKHLKLLSCICSSRTSWSYESDLMSDPTWSVEIFFASIFNILKTPFFKPCGRYLKTLGSV